MSKRKTTASTYSFRKSSLPAAKNIKLSKTIPNPQFTLGDSPFCGPTFGSASVKSTFGSGSVKSAFGSTSAKSKSKNSIKSKNSTNSFEDPVNLPNDFKFEDDKSAFGLCNNPEHEMHIFGDPVFGHICTHDTNIDDELSDITSMSQFYSKYSQSLLKTGIDTVNKLAATHSKYKKLKYNHACLHVRNDNLKEKHKILLKKYKLLEKTNEEIKKIYNESVKTTNKKK